MTKTIFKIVKVGDTYTVFDNNHNIVVHGFPTIEFALHGLWVALGGIKDEYYKCSHNGDVLLSKLK